MMQTGETRWHELSSEEALTRLGSSPGGLSAREAAARLQQTGPNTIERGRRTNPWAILLHQFTSPLIYILLVAMAVTLAIQHWADAIVIGAVVILNAVIGFTQEYRAENAMEALLRLVTPQAKVIRDGREQAAPSESLVPGDIVLLESGSLVPADLRLVRSTQLAIEEAVLTGESVPATKTSVPLANAATTGDQRNMAFLGTTVSSGRGTGVVVATGNRTQMGSIAREMRETERAVTPLQERMAQFGRWIAAIILTTSAVAFAWGLAVGEPLVDMFLTAVAIAVSAIPEGLPVAMTIALAVSVRRMARRNAIIRRLAAVETLGSCTVIMSDKTGTLTENRMTVREVYAGGLRYTVTGSGRRLDGDFRHDDAPVLMEGAGPLALTLQAGVLSNEASLSRQGQEYAANGDPTEIALLAAGAKAGLSREALLDAHPLLAEIPFESERQYSASIHSDNAIDDGERVFVKGAPERVIAMCDTWMTAEGPIPLNEDHLLHEARRMAERGLRVLAMATGHGERARERTLDGAPGGLTFLGLQGMIDPARAEAAQAVAACQRAGIQVMMVTGDHAVTATAIAHTLGIARAHQEALTGAQIEAMADAELSAALHSTTVFARVSPAQKHRIVTLLRQQGHIVAVTGDGVNDAPALKAAHIGAAMGLQGTDVAKEASDMVLTDDNFATVYAAVEEGRTAFANIRNVTFFTLSSGVGELLAILGSLALGMPLPFLPAQILWLNLVTNGVEDVALAFEPGEERQYRQPPRSPKEGILSRLLVERLVVVAFVLAAGTLGVFAWERAQGETIEYARTAALTTMVMFQVFHVGNSRSEATSVFRKSPFSNRFLFLGVAGSVAVHVAALYLPPLQFLLRTEPLTADAWVRALLVASSIIVAVEAHKLLRGTSRHGRVTEGATA